ncbi:MAG: DUF4080 domain-containing protein [Rhodoferax sp.]|nr:DUF4080 domain-containing protein [Rhodoferax sp.]
MPDHLDTFARRAALQAPWERPGGACAPTPPAVILCTLNAKYIHASLGLRYLLANMGELRTRTVLREYTIARAPQELAQELLDTFGPPTGGTQVIGFGVYIWNVTQTCALVRELRARRPSLKIVLGGPEVSHEVEQQEIVALADHVVTGWGDVSFPKLCQALLHGPRPLMKIIAGEQPPLDAIALPYAEYTADDLAHRLLYVEASRGCPFKCAFCLSALDKTAWAFDAERFLGELDALYRRGARNFKFVDRTFNLKIAAALRILQFFLDRLPADGEAPLFVHFEVIPDHLPAPLKDMIARFPPGVLQFEVGVQTFSEPVQQLISRRQDNERTVDNLRWLARASNAHLHADLIFGLPGEDLACFGAGFDRLLALGPHEIQLGVLKRLRGTPITRLGAEWGMVYDPAPPYTVQQTASVTATDMRRFVRLARYWDLLANSGRFQRSLRLLLGQPARADGSGDDPAGDRGSPFAAMLAFSDWLWARTGMTSGLTPEMLVDRLLEYLHGERGMDRDTCRASLLADYRHSGARARPAALHDLLPPARHPNPRRAGALQARQAQHRDGRADASDGAAAVAADRV